VFLGKSHISRRTILKGIGASIALPLLDAMNPAATAWAQGFSYPPEPNPLPGFEGHFDNIPDFGSRPDAQVIADQTVVEVLGGNTCDANILRVDGTLALYGELRVATLVIGSGGQLLQYPGSSIVVKDAPIDTTFDPAQFGTGILCWGRWYAMGAVPTAFLRHDGPVAAGASSLTLLQVPTGWNLGDRLVLPDSRQVPWLSTPKRTFPWTEELQIAAIVGNVIHLAAATLFAHPAATDGLGPHAIHVTRGITVRSENPIGTRGHVLIGDKAELVLRGVAFQDMGRTTEQRLDNTTFDGPTVTHIGTNQLGRYALHLHHLHGRAGSTAPVWTIQGCVVERAMRWGVTLHGSHFGECIDNVVYRARGAGYVTEDGGESNNRIERNIACQITNPKSFQADHARSGIILVKADQFEVAFEGSGFWFRGPNNYVNDNVAACCQAQGIVYNGYYLDGPVTVPLVPAFDHHNPGDFVVYGQQGQMASVPMLECKDNEAYAVGGSGFWIVWNGGETAGEPDAMSPTYVHRPRAWHCMKTGLSTWHQGHMTVYQLVALNDPAISGLAPSASRMGFGLDLGTGYMNWRATVIGARVEGFHIGVELPSNCGDSDPIELQDLMLSNYINARASLQADINETGAHIHMVNVAAANIVLPRRTGMPAPCDFWMNARLGDKRILTPVTIEAVNWNGRSYRPYFSWQHKDYVVPQSTNPWKGYPVAGLTNEQGLAQYGKCIAGAILPAHAVADPAIADGYLTM
jgi:hypothetical protein